jgi:transcription antitermination factor NusG
VGAPVGWVLVVTQSNVEQAVVAKLAQLQFAHHLFMLRRNAVVAGRVVEQLAPAFPRYVFVDPEEQWREIKELNGVAHFVRFGDNAPEVVSDTVVDRLVAATLNDVFPAAVEFSKFRVGDKVRICGASPFWGNEGIYSHSLGDMRAAVLIDGMGRKMSISLDERDIELVVRRNKRKRNGTRRRREAQRRRYLSQQTGLPYLV